MKRFIDPRYWVALAAITLGISLGLEAGAERYIQRQGLRKRAELGELERWKGMIANLTPWAVIFANGGFTLVWCLVPAPTPDDKKALARLAREKLALPLLTESEQALWVEILNAVEVER